jgi:hypothetical protein
MGLWLAFDGGNGKPVATYAKMHLCLVGLCWHLDSFCMGQW